MNFDLLQAAEPLIALALAEDIGSGDVTSQLLVDPHQVGTAVVVAKAAGILAGLPVAEATFKKVDSRIRVVARAQDGEPVAAGDVVAEVTGPVRGILTAERVALNFLGRLSGIATLTARFVDAVANYKAVILDTRKTTPGWRVLEKYAVRCGGGRNHRLGLFDMILIKDNHLLAVGSVAAAVERARRGATGLPIEVEANTLAEVEEAVAQGVDRILLDNMGLEALREAVRRVGGRVPLEASGGVTLARVAEIAATGVDYISVGALTHSAPALDFSLELRTG